MNIALAITAARQGATIANHVRVSNLFKDENGKICAVSMRDELTGEFTSQVPAA
jgi:glycerol-3-phosphate dehydrogenase